MQFHETASRKFASGLFPSAPWTVRASIPVRSVRLRAALPVGAATHTAQKRHALSEAMHDGFNERGLAAARAAEDDGEAAVQRQLDRLALLLAEENVTGAELLRNLHDRQSRIFKDVSEPLRRSHLIVPRPFGMQMIPLLMEGNRLAAEGLYRCDTAVR